MRYILYFLVYSCLVISLFITFLYLMTVVDPGLLQLREKAARMIKTNAGADNEGVRTGLEELPSEMYIDFSELWNRSSNIVSNAQRLVCENNVKLTDLYLESNVLEELIRVTLGPQTADIDTKKSLLYTSQKYLRRDTPSLRKDYETEDYTNLLKYSIQKVVPPVWPINPTPPISKTVGSPEDRALYETEKVGIKSTTSNINDNLSVIKRSVNDIKQLGTDLNSIVLKIIDDSGQFNIEIKIGLNDGFVKKNNETRDSKIQSKDKSKYSIWLKTKDNKQFKKTNLEKNTILSVMPNDFVTVDEYDDHLEEKNKIKNNTIQASIVDFNNSTKYNITENKATAMPIYRDVFKPIVIFYNQTKSIYHSGTKVVINEKTNLLEKRNDANDGCKTNHNIFNTANNTAHNLTKQTEKTNNITYNLIIQTEKGDKNTEKGDLLEKPIGSTDRCQTNVNSSKTANNTVYNLTTQVEKWDRKNEKGDLSEKPNDASDRCLMNLTSSNTPNNTAYNLTTHTEKGNKKSEKGDLSEKSNDASDGCQTNLNNSNTENNTAYNLTTQTEKEDKKTEKGDLLEKPNDASDGCKTNLNNYNTKNNTANNLTTHTEKGDKKPDKGDLLEIPNDASDGCKTNLNSFKTANNTAHNLTIQTGKTALQYYVFTTRNENTLVKAENSTISTNTLDENSTMAEKVNSTILLANGNSIQNDTRDLVEKKNLCKAKAEQQFKI